MLNGLAHQVNRRDLLKAGALSAGMFTGLSSCASANSVRPPLVFSSPSERLKTKIKLIGSLAQSVIYLSFGGTLWGVAPNAVPKPICGFEGLARSDWRPVDGGRFSQTSFDIGYFCDLETREPIESVVNPLSGESVAPFHYRYGGGETIYGEQADHVTQGAWSRLGNQTWFNERSSGEFPSPFPPADWPRESAGETLYFGSETTYTASNEQLTDEHVKQADHSFFWSSFLSWEPWLLMDGVPGFVQWRGVGAKLRSVDEVPAMMCDYIEKNWPTYFDEGSPWEGRASTYESYRQQRKPARPR